MFTYTTISYILFYCLKNTVGTVIDSSSELVNILPGKFPETRNISLVYELIINNSIAGLYEESHGITSNSMWDTVFKERFTLRTHDPKWWKDGEPIWITSVLQNRKSATFFWPGSEIVYQNTRPTHWRMYNQSVPFKTRVDQVMQWLKGDINMATLYFHEPDSSGHKYGPHGTETRAMVAEMDRLMGYIIEQMKNLGLWDTVNMIVTSDHGMQDSPTNQIIELSDYANMSGLVEEVGDYGPTCNILPKEGKTMEVMANSTDSKIKILS